MRVLKCAQIFGVVTGVLLLGGTALADNSSGSSNSGHGLYQKADAKGQTPSDQSVQPPADSGGSPSVSGANSTTDSPGNSDNASNNSASSASSKNQTSNAVTNGKGDGSGSTGGTSSTPSASSAQGATDLNAAPASTSDNIQTPATTTSGGRGAASASTIPVVQATYHASSSNVVMVTFHLALQPPIMSYHYAAIPDFATNLPLRAPASRAPAPPKTNGVLGELSVALDNMLVPQQFGPHWLDLGWVALSIGLLALVLILGNVYRYNYGWWLRRGGFVTSPRSDAPVGANLIPSLIATPLCMGYVKADLCAHSPSLVV